MRFKGPEKSSILLLGRNTVVIGAIVIIAVSFVFGYFFGYKGAGTQEQGKQEGGTAPAGAVPPEEKKILDTSGNAPVLPPAIKPPEFPKEVNSEKTASPTPDKPAESVNSRNQAAGPRNETPGKIDNQKLGEAPADNADDEAGPAPKTAKVYRKAKGKKTTGKVAKSAEAAKQPAEVPGEKGTYSVQVGAFPSREGAEHLQKSLLERKIKAYIVDTGPGNPYFRVRIGTYKNKGDAEKMSLQLQKKEGLQNFITNK